jgi:hypothetical protein
MLGFFARIRRDKRNKSPQQDESQPPANSGS